MPSRRSVTVLQGWPISSRRRWHGDLVPRGLAGPHFLAARSRGDPV